MRAEEGKKRNDILTDQGHQQQRARVQPDEDPQHIYQKQTRGRLRVFNNLRRRWHLEVYQL